MSVAPTNLLSPLLDDQVERNKRRAMLMMASLVVAVLVVVVALGALIGAGAKSLVAGVIVAVVLALAAYRKSAALVLALCGARLADPVEYARLHNLVEGLCSTAGLPKPGVYVVDDDALNAFATGRSPRHAAIVVTTGLVSRMNRIELEGLLAHELSHVKNRDTLVSTLAVTVVGPVTFLLPLPKVARLMHAAVGRRREALADLTGVSLTRYPPGLIAAMEKLGDGTTVVQSASRATAHLWLESPLSCKDGSRLHTHAPLEERIAALREL
ncbi:MAG: M48 family metalloprotease [Acidimicrobiales bacterium]